ncbi:molybdopterin-guanine dinucleotide biosynthesis protein MobA [Nocardioides sp. OK12]|uniref:nucleotidyltransferase family protein n=1 Tax=Nocardioides TaxID=1839 RepID=UPI0021C46AEB|nr:NTP transferase domain-containing protein [Nocardioides sp. OK12]GHJ59050.1 molybdopterin-guanine dinucleotide biosynthesis protein MobA [Nocardioides sp. OK12]
MHTTGLLLAAGAGRRMGTPKALVTDDEGPWLTRAVHLLEDGGCDEVVVVLGAAAAEAVRLLQVLDDTAGVEVVLADRWAEGMGASLEAGLAALEAGPAEAALVLLVDLPDLVPEVVRRVRAAGEGPAALARASYDGAPGHPVLIGREHWAGVRASAVGDQGARDYLAAHEVRLVECGDLSTGDDVDTPPTSR